MSGLKMSFQNIFQLSIEGNIIYVKGFFALGSVV